MRDHLLFGCLVGILVFSFLAPLTVASISDNDIVGTWACQSMNAGAYTGRPCRTEPWLKLYPEGKYEWGREQGRWQFKEKALTLSERKGSGHLNSDGKLVFEYDLNGKHYALTLYKRAQ